MDMARSGLGPEVDAGLTEIGGAGCVTGVPTLLHALLVQGMVALGNCNFLIYFRIFQVNENTPRKDLKSRNDPLFQSSPQHVETSILCFCKVSDVWQHFKFLHNFPLPY